MQSTVYVPLATCFTVDALQATLVITLLSFATVPLRPSASEAMHAFAVQMEEGDELGLPRSPRTEGCCPTMRRPTGRR